MDTEWILNNQSVMPQHERLARTPRTAHSAYRDGAGSCGKIGSFLTDLLEKYEGLRFLDRSVYARFPSPKWRVAKRMGDHTHTLITHESSSLMVCLSCKLKSGTNSIALFRPSSTRGPTHFIT